jgi:hypothetical protein
VGSGLSQLVRSESAGSASKDARFASQSSGQGLLDDLRDTCRRDAEGVAAPDLVQLTRLWVGALVAATLTGSSASMSPSRRLRSPRSRNPGDADYRPVEVADRRVGQRHIDDATVLAYVLALDLLLVLTRDRSGQQLLAL